MASKPSSYAPLENDLILRASKNQPIPRPPCWAMRQAGRYLPQYHREKGNLDFFACCRNPEVASNLTVQPIDEYAGLIDAAIIFSDILVIPQALGMEVHMVDGVGPRFPHRLETPRDEQYGQVMARGVEVVEGELGYVFEALAMTMRKLAGRVPLFGFCGAPWTLLCYMVEGGGSKIFKEAKTWIYTWPGESRELLYKLAQVCVEYLAQQVKAGAQMVQVFDSNAGELSPASFRKFSLPYLTYIAEHLPPRLKALGLDLVPMTVFAKGAWYALPDLCASNYDVISLDWLHDPAEAYATAQAKGKVLQGNMDPGVLYGSHEAIEQAVVTMVKGFGSGKKGWICNLGHGVTPFVDKEKLRFFLQKVHEHGSGTSAL